MDDFVQLDYPPLEESIKKAQADDPRLASFTLTGGSGQGWSRTSTLQKCARAFKYSYVDANSREGEDDVSLSIGSGVHACLAIYYSLGLHDARSFWDRVCHVGTDPFVGDEVTRIFNAYVDYYGDRDYIIPLAVEQRAVNPETGDTCRYDLIARIDDPPLGELPGMWIIEHKTASIFNKALLDGWSIDGEILGEYTHWSRSGFVEKYGLLQGICVNILGKQKEPKFHRSFETPTNFQIKEHLASLDYFRSYEQTLAASGFYPRSTSSCIGRYGACRWYEKCRGY